MSDRNHGMDLLRLLSAMMIVTLHFCLYSDNLLIATMASKRMFVTANMLEALCICGVNAFVIASCYINIQSAHTDMKGGVKRLLKLWAQTALLSVPVCILLRVFGVASPSAVSILQSLLPILTRGYWFITVFAGFSLLLPLLNRIVANASTATLSLTAGILMFMYSVAPTFLEYFGWVEVQHGYSLVWFVSLYFCTAVYIRLERKTAITQYIGIIGYFLMSAAILASVIVLGQLSNRWGLAGSENYIVRNYASIPVVLQAFCLFMFCSRIKIHSSKIKKALVFFANGSLISYILHMHPMLKEMYVDLGIAKYFPTSPVVFTIACIVTACALVTVSAVLYKLLEKPVALVSARVFNLLWTPAMNVINRAANRADHHNQSM